MGRRHARRARRLPRLLRPHGPGATAPVRPAPDLIDARARRQGRRSPTRIAAGEWVVDLRNRTAFAAGHVTGTLNFGVDGQFATYLGWLIPWGTPLTLLGDSARAGRRGAARARPHRHRPPRGRRHRLTRGLDRRAARTPSSAPIFADLAQVRHHRHGRRARRPPRVGVRRGRTSTAPSTSPCTSCSTASTRSRPGRSGCTAPAATAPRSPPRCWPPTGATSSPSTTASTRRAASVRACRSPARGLTCDAHRTTLSTPAPPTRRPPPTPRRSTMCRPATCKTCGKTTWAGCGQHVDQVMRDVPRGAALPGPRQGRDRRRRFRRLACSVADLWSAGPDLRRPVRPLLSIPLGLLIGLALGALGGGGSILTVPALVYVLGQDAARRPRRARCVIVGTHLAHRAGAARTRRSGPVRRRGCCSARSAPPARMPAPPCPRASHPPVLLTAFAGLMLARRDLMLATPRAVHGRRRTPLDPTLEPMLTLRPLTVRLPTRRQGRRDRHGRRACSPGSSASVADSPLVPALVLALAFPMPVPSAPHCSSSPSTARPPWPPRVSHHRVRSRLAASSPRSPRPPSSAASSAGDSPPGSRR